MSSLTFAIGDVHGCLAKLRRLLKACEAHAQGRPARYVFLGDYIDRGPRSRGVIELLMGLQARRPDTVICLRGNHEQMAIMAHESDRAMPMWLNNNGASTQRSYWRTGGRIPDVHLDWLRSLPLSHDDGLRFFVHAGVDLAVPLDRQSEAVMLWMREPFLTLSEHVSCGRFIVHGHTPVMTGGPEVSRNRVNLDTGAVIGGPLTAGVFDDARAEPVAFVTDRRSMARWLGRMFARREAA
jgi:serine/threonine protein phosphatase 1